MIHRSIESEVSSPVPSGRCTWSCVAFRPAETMDQTEITAPRRQKAAQAAPGLLSLPSEVLLRILAAVPLEDR